MCGRPAVPNISARPSEMASTGSETSRPGASTPVPYWSEAAANSASGLNEKRASTIIASRNAPDSSNTALMICTQVVAIIPPNNTYASITTPTIATAYS
jgi:hypothetical protein